VRSPRSRPSLHLLHQATGKSNRRGVCAAARAAGRDRSNSSLSRTSPRNILTQRRFEGTSPFVLQLRRWIVEAILVFLPWMTLPSSAGARRAAREERGPPHPPTWYCARVCAIGPMRLPRAVGLTSSIDCGHEGFRRVLGASTRSGAGEATFSEAA